MKPLDKALRVQLERTVREARDVAEAATSAALKQLGVDAKTPFSHLAQSERELCLKLRDHGRQLGDALNGTAEQTMDRLVEEVAYEHWHRMLFARFLAENNLLMYPDPASPVPISLEECNDLAEKEGKTGWELAARFATRMLPQIFRVDSPVFELELPPEHQQRLEQLVAGLNADVFFASDSLGWVYQFWQSKKKDEVNASEVKIGARELPAVTQLFTEPYMVNFLLDNSLGAWWAAHELTNTDFVIAKSEEELRKKASLPGVPLEYLRFVKGDDEIWVPSAGKFGGWPESLSKLKVLDPCCGSGHFLVAALLMIVPMRMKTENLAAKDAVDAVLRENIHGLDIDPRCVELAAFALALTAWRYPYAGGYRRLPELNIACCGQTISAKEKDWLTLSAGNAKLQPTLEALYWKFKDAPVLGSLINPELELGTGSLIDIEWEDASAQFMKNAIFEKKDYEQSEMGVVAQGIVKAAQLLSCKYNLVIANVPFLARGRQDDTLRSYCEKYYPTAKNDLATVFLERCLQLCHKNSTSSIVLPQNWLYSKVYEEFRIKLLKNSTWHLIARLGSGAFETISGEIVQAILLTISQGNIAGVDTRFANFNCNLLDGIDVSECSSTVEKAEKLIVEKILQVDQQKQLKNPDARIVFNYDNSSSLLQKYASGIVGIQTGDDPMFLSAFWEQPKIDKSIWEYMQATPDKFTEFDGESWLIRWEQEKSLMFSSPGARAFQGLKAVNQDGIAIHRMGTLFAYRYGKERFHQNVAVILPRESIYLPAIWCFCSSSKYKEALRQIDQGLKITNATLVKVPFDFAYWNKLASKKYPYGLSKPYSEDSTQWIFHGHPAQSFEPLQVGVARLLGYRWPAEQDKNIELSDEARILIKKSEPLLTYVDEDGIVCIPPVRGEIKGEDQLEHLLAAAYGSEWSSHKKSELLAQVGYAGKTLESWLREKFFVQHCKLFHDRPFIWHIWDGLSDGFAALVNYHKLDAKKLETLIYTYLGDWISRQKQDKANGVDGAEEKLAAAEGLKKRLELILEGEAPYDIFVRWKPLEKQPIGWNPDLNDGVRLNIRPFMSVPDVGKKGAGVLRDKLNISWGKDRGKDVESAPWYKLFKGERINDHHLSLAEKRTAKST